MNKIITGEHIVKSFGEGNDKQIVINDVSLSIGEGEFISIMGPSGSGKSTMMFAMSGMDQIDTGDILFDGKNLSLLNENELADLRRTKMGFIFQQPTLLKNLNLLDNIILPSVASSKKDVKKLTQKAKEIMKKVGIEDLGDRGTTQVSGGQLQRVGICRALMSNPQIIFGDEPTGALNSKAAEEIMEVFTRINREGTAIMLVTHDAKVAAQTEKVMFMSDGKIVSEMNLSKYEGTDLEERIKKVTVKMQEIGI